MTTHDADAHADSEALDRTIDGVYQATEEDQQAFCDWLAAAREGIPLMDESASHDVERGGWANEDDIPEAA